MGQDPTARTLLLLSLLQSRTGWTVEELANRLGVSGRTVRRDAYRLRQLGYGIEARPGPGSTYRLVPGVSMPPLLFDPDEITAVVAGLHTLRSRTVDDAAARALAKLGQVLPRSLRQRAAATDLATEVLDDHGSPGVDSHTVGVVADAVVDNGRVMFSYRDQHDRTSSRRVEPYRHILRQGRWYLIGFDLDRDDWRTFRFDRVTDIERLPGTFPPRDFPHDSISQWLTTDFGRRSYSYRGISITNPTR